MKILTFFLQTIKNDFRIRCNNSSLKNNKNFTYNNPNFINLINKNISISNLTIFIKIHLLHLKTKKKS